MKHTKKFGIILVPLACLCTASGCAGQPLPEVIPVTAAHDITTTEQTTEATTLPTTAEYSIAGNVCTYPDFYFTLPDGWTTEDFDEHTIQINAPEPASTVYPNIKISTSDSLKDEFLNITYEQFKEYTEAMLDTGIKKLSFYRKTINAQKYFIIKYSAVVNEETQIFSTAIFDNGTKLVCMTFVTDEQRVFSDGFNTVLKSFRFNSISE